MIPPSACRDPFNHLNPVLVDLPCRCQDVHRDCGCINREHDYVECAGQMAAELEEAL